MDKGEPMPMASPDSRNDLAEIPGAETDRPEALITACYSAVLFSSSKVGSFRKQTKDSQAATGTGSPEQRRRTFLDAPLLERAPSPCRRRRLLAQSSWWCGVAISLAVGLLALPAARPWWWWWCGVAISLATGLLASPDSRNDLTEIPIEETDQPEQLRRTFLEAPLRERAPCCRCRLLARSSWWCGVAISLAVGLLEPPAARPWWWWWLCGVAISLAAGLFAAPMARPWWWCGVAASFLTISALWSTDKGEPKPMASPDSWNDLAEIPGAQTSRPEALITGCQDHQFPRSPLITNISKDTPKQIDAVSKSNIVSQQDGDACRSRSQNVPVFIRHCSGLVLLTLNLDESSEHMMNLYEQKTKTKIGNRYFKYGLKRIEPEHTLRSYGIGRNTTVDLCGRMLGGKTDTLENYVTDNGENFSVEVSLPDGNMSLDMTKLGCLFLLTLLKCFTHAFANFKSWNGDITMDDFKVTDGHVRVIKTAEEKLNSSSLQADLKVLIYFIRKIFYKDNSKLTSKYPPYVKSLISFLLSLRGSFLSDDDKLFIETHMSCLESFARGMLLIKLRKKYKSLPQSKKDLWIEAIEGLDMAPIPYTSANQVSEIAVFCDIITHAKNENKPYSGTRCSTFRLFRDEFAHAPSHRFDKSVKPWIEKFKNDNGIELMVPAKFNDLLPTTIRRLIKAKGIDIKKELLAAQVRCTCPLCHPFHLELNKLPSQKHTKDGGESSKHGGEMSKHGDRSSKGVTQTAVPSQKVTSSLGLSKALTQTALPSQEATGSSEGSQAKKPSLLKNATTKASPQKMQPSTPGSSQVEPKLPSTTKKKGKKKKGENKCSTVRGGYSVSMLWLSITIFLLLFCLIVAAVFLL